MTETAETRDAAQDPIASATMTVGKTWADFKASMNAVDPDAPPEAKSESLTPEQEETVDLIHLQENLLTVARVNVSLGHLKAQDNDSISACVKWLAFYSGASRGEVGEEVPDRPAWLPLPNADR